MVIVAVDRSDLQVLIENCCGSGAIDAPLVALTSAIIALVSVEDDDGAFLNDTRCTSRRD